MQKVKVWDPLVRIFHWSLVVLFTANAVVVEDESTLHIWVGYIVAALIAVRIIWGFVGTKYARFDSFRPSASAAIGQLM
ncbi:MAG: cytochrome b/b6 domain-containing protein, partial [Roseibium sp.]